MLQLDHPAEEFASPWTTGGGNAEPIPGYRLLERLASGGCGEVWRAAAPGGLTKAVKIVYGSRDDRRASAELKSLNRIKELNHPFLLSLERIEVVDGHLMIVTELADGSLRNRFEECRRQGLDGMPREELMKYLREAADALDFLGQQHGLQHLDVKPENLLLVAGHIKVGDFGLLKSLEDQNASLINGLTPKYAAPEVFDGRPSRRSDQYSLAIVFQELATGRCPFNGRTAAQLASQHLHSAPDLEDLTPSERFAVGKALSKNPDARFDSCRELIDRLVPRGGTTMFMKGGSGPSDALHSTRLTRSAHASSGGESSSARSQHDGQTCLVSAPLSVGLPAIVMPAEAPPCRPTLFVGIGHTGGAVLTRLRGLFGERFQSPDLLPALAMLYLDTDSAAITEATKPTGDMPLREAESLLLPLRNTWNYRNGAVSRMTSISRRWLYNIPKTLRTEGLRALGRLAFLDNVHRVVEHLRGTLLAITTREAAAATATATGLALGNTDPRVFIVGSVGGGTGSGIVIDLAYLIRQILAESGLSDDEVIGLLTYCTKSGMQGHGLSPANAYACLTELEYFGTAGNDYPGEPTCGLAGFRENRHAFKHAYFVDCGEDLSQHQFAERAGEVAMWLYLNSTSPASAFFDQARGQPGSADESATLQFRTFYLQSLGAETGDVPAEWIGALCRDAVGRWRGGLGDCDPIRAKDYGRLLDAQQPDLAAQDRADEWVARRMAEGGVETKLLEAGLRQELEESIGEKLSAYLDGLVEHCLVKFPSRAGGAEFDVRGVLSALEAVLLGASEEPGRQARESLQDSALAIAAKRGKELGQGLSEEIISRLEDPDCRAAGARLVVDAAKHHLEVLHEQAAANLRAAKADRDQLQRVLVATDGGPSAKKRGMRPVIEEGLARYARLLADEVLVEGTLALLRSVEPWITSSSDQLRDLWKDLNRLAGEFAAPAKSPAQLSGGTVSDVAGSGAMGEAWAQRRPEMIDRLEAEIETTFFRDRGRLLDVLTKGGDLRAAFVQRMREVARRSIREVARASAVAQVHQTLSAGPVSGAPAALSHSLNGMLKAANAVGGGRRLFLIASESLVNSSLPDQARSISGDEATVIRDTQKQALMGYEVEGLSASSVRNRFLKRSPNCEELASRLHTRADIVWP